MLESTPETRAAEPEVAAGAARGGAPVRSNADFRSMLLRKEPA